MRVLSVNCGRAEPIANAKASGMTGIYKRPVATALAVTTLGLAEDAICDTENHGGVDQAIYVYGAPDYAWWSSVLGYDLEPGTFGENITITDLESANLAIGDRLHIGALTLEVTAPRIPCVTLARRMNDPAFLKRFREAERPGVYCRVIQEGMIQAGDEVQYESYAGESVSAIELFRDFFEPHDDEATIRRHLRAPLAFRACRDKEAQLERLLARQAQPH
jgi:MOSC domain-containing protein YiiM